MQEWIFTTFQETLPELGRGLVSFVVDLLLALFVFIIGWSIAVTIGKLIAEILKRIKFNRLFEKGGWKEALEKAEVKIDPAGFIGAIFKWVLIIVALMLAVEILGLVQFAIFLGKILDYLPNVVIAALIFVVTVIIADIVEKVIRAAVEGAKIGYGQLVGVVVKWSIWVFAILAILMQLKIAPVLLQTLFTGFVALLVIAGGIAFGLGGKEVAAEILQDLKRKLKG